MTRSQSGGFTFIEALAVAIIVAVLAAVVIPTYNEYVESQRVSVVTNIAKAASVTLGAYFRRNGPPPEDDAGLKAIVSIPNPAAYVIEVGPAGNATWVRVRESADATIISPMTPFR